MSSTSSGDLLADRRFGYAEDLAAGGDFAAAAELMEQALVQAPGWAAGWLRLGEWCEKAGRREDAITAYRHTARLDADGRLGAGLHLAALGAIPRPAGMPENYVRALFDDYAPRFEEALTERLDYAVPKLIAAMLGPQRFGRGLDLGCGTGLMGTAVRGMVDDLTGVDLSAAMLKVARSKGIYARLVAAEAVAFLAGEPPAAFDLVLAADMAPYLGRLDPLFAAVARVLAPDAIFALSAERHDGEDFVLGAKLRYRHSRSAIVASADNAGLVVVQIDKATLRSDGGRPVAGYVSLFAAPPRMDGRGAAR